MEPPTTVKANGTLGAYEKGHEDGPFSMRTTVKPGMIGNYRGPHKDLEDWHWAEFDIGGDLYSVPGHMPAHFERIDAD